MADYIRYCKAGHRFEITGDMTVGQVIEVNVVPRNGYSFEKWSDNDTSNPRRILITKCGVTYIAVFKEEETNLQYVFDGLEDILNGNTGGREYKVGDETEEGIINALNGIIGN